LNNLETQYDDAETEFKAGTWGLKSGKATFTAATTLVVTHGMAVAPTKVLVTGSDANSATLWVTAIGAVTFQINRGNATGTPDVYWMAQI
jgi:hypothetical protein